MDVSGEVQENTKERKKTSMSEMKRFESQVFYHQGLSSGQD